MILSKIVKKKRSKWPLIIIILDASLRKFEVFLETLGFLSVVWHEITLYVGVWKIKLDPAWQY